MSKNPSDNREVILLEDIPRSGTPEPAPKRQRTSRSSSKRPNQDSSRSEESRASAARRGQVSEAGDSASRGTSKTRPARSSIYQRILRSVGPWEGLLPKRHLRYPMDPSDRKTSGEADAEATPAMGTSTSMDPSDRETSGQADTETTPALLEMLKPYCG